MSWTYADVARYCGRHATRSGLYGLACQLSRWQREVGVATTWAEYLVAVCAQHAHTAYISGDAVHATLWGVSQDPDSVAWVDLVYTRWPGVRVPVWH